MATRSLTENFNRVSKPPEGWAEGAFRNAEKQRIRYAHIPATMPDNAPSRGTIVITHGYGEFIDLYYESIKEYQAQGFDVWAMDWQGFGGSSRDNPKRPHISDAQGMNQHVRDLDQFIKDVVKPDGTKPMIMSTHSMGGHPGMLYLQRNPGMFDAAVMSAPMFDIYRLNTGSWFRPIVRGIFNLASHLGLRDRPVPALEGMLAKLGDWREENGERTASIPDLRAAWLNAIRARRPENAIARPSFGWINAVFDTVGELNDAANLRKVDIPVLIGSAGHETLVDNNAHAAAVRILPKGQLVTLPTASHSLWQQPEPNYTRWAAAVNHFTDTVLHNFYTSRNQPVPAASAESVNIVTRLPKQPGPLHVGGPSPLAAT